MSDPDDFEYWNTGSEYWNDDGSALALGRVIAVVLTVVILGCAVAIWKWWPF
jgi:hypothetical protein